MATFRETKMFLGHMIQLAKRDEIANSYVSLLPVFINADILLTHYWIFENILLTTISTYVFLSHPFIFPSVIFLSQVFHVCLLFQLHTWESLRLPK